MANERVIRETPPGREGNPAAAIVAALLVALLIGVGIYLFANRNDDNGGVIDPAPRSSTSQETSAPTEAPTSDPTEAPSSEPSVSSTP